MSAVVDLFLLVKHEKDLDWEILISSTSHDPRICQDLFTLRCDCGHEVDFYRHLIASSTSQSLKMKDQCLAFRFAMSVNLTWMPTHFHRLYFVINTLPADLNLELSYQAEA